MLNKTKTKSIIWRPEIILAYAILIAAALIWVSIISPRIAEGKTIPMIPASFANVAEKASPAVVNISTVRITERRRPRRFGPFGHKGGKDPFDDFFDRFFNDQGPRKHKQRSLGSGFIIDPSGLIITNNHVIEDADEVIVRMSDEKEFKAEVIGRDVKTDIALIKIKDSNRLPFLKLGDSSKLRIGDWVVAIGNPFGLEHTVTAGILSARGRVIGAGPYDDFLQTDASINPGNSGGPLLNLEGEVIGINSAIIAGGSGIGFAIPSTMAKGIIEQLKESGKVTRGWLGVVIQKITPDLAEAFNLDNEKGALVANVVTDGPAKKAGLKQGDVIITFDGQEVEEMNDLPGIVAKTRVGAKVKVVVIRNGKEKTIAVKIGELKDTTIAEAKVETKENELGLKVETMTPELATRLRLSDSSGVIIKGIKDDSPASESGLRPGDLIVEINRDEIKNMADYDHAIDEIESKDTALFLIKRRGNTLFFTLKAE